MKMAEKQEKETKENKEAQLQQSYMELQMMAQQLKQLQQQIQHIDSQVEELTMTEMALDEMPNAKQGSEMLAPLASGIFIKTKMDKNDTVVLNVGAGTAVEKSVKEARDLVETQKKEIMKLREQMAQQFEHLSAQVQTMQLQLGE
jgi:prefoldin alpha subunit